MGDQVLALNDEARELLRTYSELLTVVHEHAASEVNYEELAYSSIHGMLRTLDPHTSFLAPEAYDSMRDRQRSSFHGLGILVGLRNGLLTVVTPIEGTPASNMGIRAGDVIHSIEGEPTQSMNIDEAVRRLKGPKGTSVTIQIIRTGFDEPLELTITRAEIPQNTVRYAYMIEPGTGYVALSDFNRGTAQEMATAIDKLKAEGMERLLLDLRNNGGGLLDQAVDVADKFLPAGSAIVETRGRTRDSFQSFSASDNRPDLGIPVVVLVNAGTASAAEILAGAIQDHDVGIIVGMPTWGKGLVQTVYTLSYGSGIAITTAKYYTPSGRLIQRDYSSYYDYQSHSDQTVEVGPASRFEGAPVYRTDLGREVYGGGGITPDISVELDELPESLQTLLARSSFFDYGVVYAAKNAIPDRHWQPDDQILAGFREWLVEQGVSTADEIEAAFANPEIRESARRYLHAEIFNAAFGFEARHQVLARGDKQIARGLEAFLQALDLLARRQSLEVPEQRASLGGA
jgi:carboxyl-terminal processing protease